MEVVVEVGGWEHECCGAAIERNQLVDLECIRSTAPDGRGRLVETHHGFELPTMERVLGRVVEIEVVHDGRDPRPILRVPSGVALLGFDEQDDGHLEDPWTGEAVLAEGGQFLVTVRTAHRPSLR